jgi:predicted  nucleic acid-binding Zn-ribbon protein
MHGELSKLLDLQGKDLALIAVEERRRGLIEKIAALDGKVAQVERDVEVTRQRLDDAVKKREALEVRIESYRTIQDKRRQRLETVRGAREAQAVMTEVEMARSVLVKEESEWVKASEGVHDLERQLKSAEEQLAEVRQSQETERADVATELKGVEAERAEAKTERDRLAADIERSLRGRYDRLRGARTVAVVVPLRGEACGACFTTVPRHRRTQIRAGILLDNCEACGVILYAEDA